MINVKIDEKTIDTSTKYPTIMEGDTGGLLVLFSCEYIGTVIGGNAHYEVGYHTAGWAIDTFKPFNKSITLENSND